MTDRLSLQPRYRLILEDLLREHVPDAEVWAYGSRVNGQSHEGSDLDLVVRGPELESLGIQLLDLLVALQESNIPILVQVHDWASLPESFHREIERDYVVIQPSDSKQVDSECRWHEAVIGDVALVIGGGTPSTKDAKNFDGDIPWLTPKDLSGIHDRYIMRGERSLSQKGLDSSSARLLPEGAVLLSTRAPIGYVALAGNPIATNQGFRSLIPNNNLLAEYLYYWLLMNVERLEQHATGTTFRELSGSALKAIRISLPPLPEQREIARVLGALDDKIELNRRMCETLEEMAQSLFKSWFVDFEPVRAKMDGRWCRGESLPGLPAEHYDLFPNRLVPSEVGPIPEGWKVKTLGDVVIQRRSVVEPRSMDPRLPYIALEHIPKRRIALSDWSDAEGVASAKLMFAQHDILFGRLRPYFHKVCVAPVDGVCSTDIVVMLPTSRCWFGFILGHVFSEKFVNYTSTVVTGTRMPRTKWEDMAQFTVALPGIEVARALDDKTRQSIGRMLSAIHESRALVAQRDALLPKLVSGEVRVGEVMEMV